MERERISIRLLVALLVVIASVTGLMMINVHTATSADLTIRALVAGADTDVLPGNIPSELYTDPTPRPGPGTGGGGGG